MVPSWEVSCGQDQGFKQTDAKGHKASTVVNVTEWERDHANSVKHLI